jgi:hypothetical protein
MPLDTDERERLIGVAQNYADASAPDVRVLVEDTGGGVLMRGAWRDQHGHDHFETLNIAWELVERSDAPEHFLRTQVWAVEHGLLPPGASRRDRPD